MNKIIRLVAFFSFSAFALSSCGDDTDDTQPTQGSPVTTETCKVNTVTEDSEVSTFVYNPQGKLTSINIGAGSVPVQNFTHAGDSIVYLDDNRAQDPSDYTREALRVTNNQVASIRATTRERGEQNTIIESNYFNVFNTNAQGRVSSVTRTGSARVLDEEGQTVISNTPASTGTITMNYNAEGAITSINVPADAISQTPALTVRITPATNNARNARIPVIEAIGTLFSANSLLASPLLNMGEKLFGKIEYSVGPFNISSTFTYTVDAKGNVTSMVILDESPFGSSSRTVNISYNCQ